jgi:hypothetical protein
VRRYFALLDALGLDNDVADIQRITQHGLPSEAIRWGLTPERAAEIVGALCDRAEDALETAGPLPVRAMRCSRKS